MLETDAENHFHEVNSMASETVEAIYQDGVLKPLRTLELPDNAHVWIQVVPTAGEETPAQARAEPSRSENRFQLRLLELGLLREVKARSGVPEGNRTPIQVKGKPLSQTIIEERR